MFAVRRIFRNRQTLSNCICTSSVVQGEKSKKSENASNSQMGEESPKSVETPKSEGKKFKNLFAKSTKADKIKSRKTSSGAKVKTNIFKKVLMDSAEKVAEDLGGNKTETKMDLLSYIKTFEVTKEPPKKAQTSVEGVDVPFTISPIFSESKGMNIFHKKIMERTADQVQLKLWDTLEAEDLEYISLTAPKNQLEEWIRWTEEGKLWLFPIDNDQGLEEEGNVSFTEHIFLEQHLEPWCPKRGPLRKFMELVLIGLGKNPYLTVEDKKEHIKWFQNYFENKKKLLQELGAMGATKEIDV